MRIIVVDDLNPEDNAMSQALKSRSPAPIEDHLSRIERVGSGKFMEQYYVNYGHKSIGDCGFTTIHIEDVSLLAAKAIQDHPLYNGQENSTRYMDFSSRQATSARGTVEEKEIQDLLFAFYEKIKDPVLSYLKEGHYPPNVNKTDKKIEARAYDIRRGFLPAGCLTSLSWTSTLSNLYEQLSRRLVFHPLKEVRDIAKAIWNSLRAKYPNSFPKELVMKGDDYYYAKAVDLALDTSFNCDNCDYTEFAKVLAKIRKNKQLFQYLQHRPMGVQAPSILKAYGEFGFNFCLDYGSFRDLQRHRRGFIEMPVLSLDLGFNQWYLEQLSTELENETMLFLSDIVNKISRFQATDRPSKFELQYLIPIGFNVSSLVRASLDQWIYVLELRSKPEVHPTLRNEIKRIHKLITIELKDIPIHINTDNYWVSKRGEQTILPKS